MAIVAFARPPPAAAAAPNHSRLARDGVLSNAYGFRFGGGDARTTILGATGSGKSTCGLWMLSFQRFDRRPWIVFDFKRESFFDAIGFPPIRQIPLTGKLPRAPGLYLVSPRPGQDELVDKLLWRIWEQENIGLYIDELALMPDQSDALAAIYQQGRSKRLPVIGCSQRPVGVVRGVFSEASFFAVYRMADRRDYALIQGFVPADMSQPLPPFCWHWYDVARDVMLDMKPVPHPRAIAAKLTNELPYRANDWHPFKWTGRPSGRDKLTLIG